MPKGLPVKISILLPVLSIVVVALVFMRPEITGMVTAPVNVLRAEIKVTTADGVILPRESVIELNIGNESSGMPISLFIEKSGVAYELAEGEVPEIGYSGLGYTGNHTYTVPISEFNISRRVGIGRSEIRVEITYDGSLVSGARTEVLV